MTLAMSGIMTFTWKKSLKRTMSRTARRGLVPENVPVRPRTSVAPTDMQRCCAF
jgi:hypothetical protein